MSQININTQHLTLILTFNIVNPYTLSPPTQQTGDNSTKIIHVYPKHNKMLLFNLKMLWWINGNLPLWELSLLLKDQTSLSKMYLNVEIHEESQLS